MTTDIQSFSDLYAVGQTKALLRTAKLTKLSWSPGYMIDIQTGMSAAMAEEVERIAVELNAKHYFAQASGEDLDTLANDHFGLPRNDGVSAVGIAKFYRVNADGDNVTIPAGTIVQTADGLQFVTTNAPLMTGLEINANIAAVLPGALGIVNADTVVVINAANQLTDSSVQVTNVQQTAGGSEAENDAEFRARIIGWFQTLRRATGAALVTGAKFAGSVKDAAVDESAYPPTVYIADVTGAANDALVAAVTAELVNWRAAGIQVNVVGASVIYQDIDLSVVFAAGSDTSEVRDQVEAAVIAQVATLSIAETLYSSSIVAAALAVNGVVDCIVNDPSGDVAPAADELLRAGAVSFSA